MSTNVILVAIILLEAYCVWTLNIARLRLACRVEDGFGQCTSRGECRRRQNIGPDCDTDHFLCTNDEVRCNSTRICVPRYFIGKEDGCISENRSLRLPCRENEFKCKMSGLCIPRMYVRNGLNDCIATDIDDFSDEMSSFESCNSEEFRCEDEMNRCIPREWVLDGHQDCSDRSDELRKLGLCMENEFQCGNGRCIRRYRVMDGFADCEDGLDESNSRLKCNMSAEFKCNKTGRCIPRSWVMDGINHCKDSSDEMVSEKYACLESEFSCGRRCLPSIYLCDGIKHCEDCSDEKANCDKPPLSECSRFMTYDNSKDVPHSTNFGFKCSSGLIVPQWSLDDGHAFCENGSDICFKSESFMCARCLESGKIIRKEQVCDGVLDCSDLSDECLCETCSDDTLIQQLCDSVCYSDTISDSCYECSRGQLRCPGESKCINMNNICDEVVDCSQSQIDEDVCGRVDRRSCSYGKSDSCSAGMFAKDPISSPEKMIRNPVFIALIWIQAVFAIFGNAIVIYKRATHWKGYSNPKRCGAVMRMSMAISNFGFGVMLVVIGSASSAMSGRYCENDINWRQSPSCKSIGTITTWFAEASIFTLLLISGHRVYSVYNPFKARSERLRTASAWAILTWILSLILCCVPLFDLPPQSVAIDVHISPSPYFKGPVSSWEDYKRYHEKIATLAPHLTTKNCSYMPWNGTKKLQEIHSDIFPRIVGRFGYYQAHGVCLPKWISTDEALPLPTYTAFVFVMNVASVTVAVIINSALLLWLASKKIGQTKRAFLQSAAHRRQVMILTLSFAYFFCWLGIIIISFSSGSVSAAGFSIGTLVLFPLPSALSPVILTVGFKDVRTSVALKLKRKG